VEVTCQEGDERWRQAERLTDWVVDDLVRVDMLAARSAVHDVRIERVSDAYPIYHKHYPADLERATKAFSTFENLHMAGRCGTFWYNNMDHCVEAALGLCKRLLHEAGVTVGEEALAAGSVRIPSDPEARRAPCGCPSSASRA
jgi:protoporphyrinogen oxidase